MTGPSAWRIWKTCGSAFSLSHVLGGEGWGEGRLRVKSDDARLHAPRAPLPALSPAYRGEGLAYHFQPRVLEDQRLATARAEIDHRPRVLAHVGDFLDAADAELGVADH